MISAVLITLNEERNIGKALKSLEGVVQEVIVVDCDSSDKTVKFAQKMGAKVYFRKFDNFANQKNWATNKATNPWILSLDADEVIPSGLALEIRQAVKNEKFSAFFIPRRNFILGGEIKHSRWNPDVHIWLWRKDKGKWVGDVHEEVIVSGKAGKLKNAKFHFKEDSVSELIKSNDFYSSLLAESLFKKGVRFSQLHLIWDPIFEFFIRFVYKLGFLDGWRGFVLAYLMVIYRISVLIKIYELQYIKK